MRPYRRNRAASALPFPQPSASSGWLLRRQALPKAPAQQAGTCQQLRRRKGDDEAPGARCWSALPLCAVVVARPNVDIAMDSSVDPAVRRLSASHGGRAVVTGIDRSLHLATSRSRDVLNLIYESSSLAATWAQPPSLEGLISLWLATCGGNAAERGHEPSR